MFGTPDRGGDRSTGERDEHDPARVTAGDLLLDMRGRLMTQGGRPVVVKPREFDLLFFLMGRVGDPVSRDELIVSVWGSSVSAHSRTLDVHIRWLRSKIERDPRRPTRLVTVKGVGYMFVG